MPAESETASSTPLDLTKNARPQDELRLVEAKIVTKIGFLGGLSNLEFAKDGKSAYVAQSTLDSAGIAVYDTATWESATTWKWEGKSFQSIVLSRDGSTLVGIHDNCLITVWDTAAGTLLHKFQHRDEGRVSTAELRGLAVSPDGKRIASSNLDLFESVVWESRTGNELYRRPTKWLDIKPAAFTPDGKTVVLWSEGRGLDLCDAETGESRLTIPLDEPRPNDIRVSPDGRTLLVVVSTRIDDTRRGYAALFDMETGKLVWNVETGIRWLSGYEFTPDGSMIALSGSMHGDYSSDRDKPAVVQLRGRDDGRLRFAFESELKYSTPTLSFSPDGKLLAVGSEIREVPATPERSE